MAEPIRSQFSLAVLTPSRWINKTDFYNDQEGFTSLTVSTTHNTWRKMLATATPCMS